MGKEKISQRRKSRISYNGEMDIRLSGQDDKLNHIALDVGIELLCLCDDIEA